MLASVLAAGGFHAPHVDWHALAPEVILTATIVVCLLIDVSTSEHSRWTASSVAGMGLLAAAIPLLTLHHDDTVRSMFGGSYVVDDFALVLKGLFLLAGYLTILLSQQTIAEGDYAEGEYYLLILSSVFGMVVMASSRDLISIFIALEMLSIPAYLLAGWRKRQLTGNEAGMKYYLMGVFASAVMLYGMSLIFGTTGHTLLSSIGTAMADPGFKYHTVAVLGVVFTLVGFAFKVSAVPFHNWAPDTYEGAPTPVTAFLSVASKTAGFVAILQLVFVGFGTSIHSPEARTIRLLFFVLAVLTMTVGNVIALRQSNIVRLFAYSSVAQAGFIMAPLVVVGSGTNGISKQIISSVVTYAIIYTIVNLGAFAVIITVSRRLGTGEIRAWSGLGSYAPGLATAMAVFLIALGGIPPLAGWWAKFQAFTAVVDGHTWLGYTMGAVMAVNSVVSLAYYLSIVRTMFMDDVPDGDTTPVKVPVPLGAVVTLALVGTVVLGVLPGLVTTLADGAAVLGLGH